MKYRATYLLWIAALVIILNFPGCKETEEVDNTDPLRTAATDLYQDEYLASEVTNAQWTGSVAGCNAGTIPQSMQDKVLQRINYFRKVVGVPPVSFTAERNGLAQQAALMSLANNDLNHDPPSTYACWTQDGYDGCHGSNLSSTAATIAITRYIKDEGASNTAVLHRWWVLLPQTVQMGHGSTNSTDALLVIRDYYEPLPDSVPEFIAWPPVGYVPAPLVFARWSFDVTHEGLDPYPVYSNGTVTMTDENGSTVSLTIIYKDQRLVWEPQNIQTTSTEDVTYHVSIGQVTVNGVVKSYAYDVKIFQP